MRKLPRASSWIADSAKNEMVFDVTVRTVVPRRRRADARREDAAAERAVDQVAQAVRDLRERLRADDRVAEDAPGQRLRDRIHLGEHHGPRLARRRRAAQLDERLRRGHAHLHRGVLAEARIGIEGQRGVVGARDLRQHVDRDVRGRRRGEHDLIAVERRLVLVRELLIEVVADLELARARRRHGEAGGVEDVFLQLRVVAEDLRRLPGTRTFDDRHRLAREADRVRVRGVLLDRDVQLVSLAGDERRELILEEEVRERVRWCRSPRSR